MLNDGQVSRGSGVSSKPSCLSVVVSATALWRAFHCASGLESFILGELCGDKAKAQAQLQLPMGRRTGKYHGRATMQTVGKMTGT